MKSEREADPLRVWREGLTIRPVLGNQEVHSLHAYFGVSPESPDAERVAVFVSDRSDGHVGKIALVRRATGETEILDDSVEVEDPHRQANQQWVCGGDFLAYMALRDGEWVIIRADPDDLTTTVLCHGRQLGWGRPHLDEVPLYGPHWDPKNYRDVEMLNVRTGSIRTVLSADNVLAEHRPFVDELFGVGTTASKSVSLFFPTLSPDGQRLFIKLAVPDDGQFRSPTGSLRDGLLVYDLPQARPLATRATWAHPCWYSDSRYILQRHTVFDAETATMQAVPKLPSLTWSHAMPSPDGTLMATDFTQANGQRQHWHLMLVDLKSGRQETIHAAPADGHGTESWRKPHPHPSFSAQGNRIYFNVNLGTWTTLHVAEVTAS